MRALFLSICICLLAPTLSLAQSNGNNRLDPKVLLRSKTDEFAAHASRNSLRAVSNSYNDIKVLLEEFMNETQLKLNNAVEPQKTQLQQKLKQQQLLYANINSLYTANPLQNSSTINTKLQSFLQTLY
ncbi:MAG: hypothetical protein R2800_09765 [Flavipsychrobacter sp.]